MSFFFVYSRFCRRVDPVWSFLGKVAWWRRPFPTLLQRHLQREPHHSSDERFQSWQRPFFEDAIPLSRNTAYQQFLFLNELLELLRHLYRLLNRFRDFRLLVFAFLLRRLTR